MRDLRRRADTIRAAMNAHDADAAVACVAEDARWADPLYGEPTVGKAPMRAALLAFFAALPDVRYAVLAVVQAGDLVVEHYRAEATHRGPYPLPGGAPAAPTGRRVAWVGTMAYRFDAQGLMVEGAEAYDPAAFLRQLGAPAPGQTL